MDNNNNQDIQVQPRHEKLETNTEATAVNFVAIREEVNVKGIPYLRIENSDVGEFSIATIEYRLVFWLQTIEQEFSLVLYLVRLWSSYLSPLPS